MFFFLCKKMLNCSQRFWGDFLGRDLQQWLLISGQMLGLYRTTCECDLTKFNDFGKRVFLSWEQIRHPEETVRAKLQFDIQFNDEWGKHINYSSWKKSKGTVKWVTLSRGHLEWCEPIQKNQRCSLVCTMCGRYFGTKSEGGAVLHLLHRFKRFNLWETDKILGFRFLAGQTDIRLRLQNFFTRTDENSRNIRCPVRFML